MHVKCYLVSISVVLCYNVSERIYRKGEQSGVKQKLLLIDAMNIDAPVGSFHSFTGDELNAYFKDKISVHDLGVNDMLAVLKLTDNPIEEVIVMGVKPEVVSMGLDMTEKIAEKVPEVAQKAKELVDKWVAEYQK